MANPKFTPQSRRFPLNPFTKKGYMENNLEFIGDPYAVVQSTSGNLYHFRCVPPTEAGSEFLPIDREWEWDSNIDWIGESEWDDGVLWSSSGVVIPCDACDQPALKLTHGILRSYQGDTYIDRGEVTIYASNRKKAEYVPTPLDEANEGLTRCFCGCKYWENDRCIDCGEKVTNIPGHYEATRKKAAMLLWETTPYGGQTEARWEGYLAFVVPTANGNQWYWLVEAPDGKELGWAFTNSEAEAKEAAEAVLFAATKTGTKKTAAPVKFPSKCKVCGADIPKGSGDVRKVDGAWYTTCDDHKPAPKPRYTYRPRTYKMSDGFQTIYVDEDDVYDAKRDGFYIVSLKKQAVIPPWAYPEEKELSNYDLEAILERKLDYLPECCGAVDFEFVDGWGTSGMDGVGSMGVVGEITYECGWCHARYELDFDE